MGRITIKIVEDLAKQKGYIFNSDCGYPYKYELDPDSRYHNEYGNGISSNSLAEIWQELMWAKKPDREPPQ